MLHHPVVIEVGGRMGTCPSVLDGAGGQRKPGRYETSCIDPSHGCDANWKIFCLIRVMGLII